MRHSLAPVHNLRRRIALAAAVVPLLAAVAILATQTLTVTAQSGPPPPPPLDGMKGEWTGPGEVALDWRDAEGATSYRLRYFDNDLYGWAELPGDYGFTISFDGSSAEISGLPGQGQYFFGVRSVNDSGASDWSGRNIVVVKPEATPEPTPEATPQPTPESVPAQPTGLTAGAVSHDSVTITWDDPGDDSITGYRVLRRSRDGDTYGDGQGAAAFAAIEDDTGTAATSYTDTPVTPRTRYVYRVEAVNAYGRSPHSRYVNVETPKAPEEPAVPAQPTGPKVGAVSHDSVTITWDDPWDSSITGYRILRRSRDGDTYGDGLGAPEFVAIADDTGTAEPTYADTSVAPSTRYVYRVKAINAHELSERSDYANADTSPYTLCSEDDNAPAPVEVAVEAVPIVAESTTEEYFVLFVRPDLDSDREIPVSVTLGQDGATTLTEQLSALPKEHYRVHKFLIADPADADGDCIDDITELQHPVRMDPLNPAPIIDLVDGAVAIPGRENIWRGFPTRVRAFQSTHIWPAWSTSSSI